MNEKIKTVAELCDAAGKAALSKQVRGEISFYCYDKTVKTCYFVVEVLGEKSLNRLNENDWDRLVIARIKGTRIKAISAKRTYISYLRKIFSFGMQKGAIKGEFYSYTQRETVDEMVCRLEGPQALETAPKAKPEAPAPMTADPGTIPAPPPPTINVELVERFGSDAKAVDMARISFGSRDPFRAEQYQFIKRLLKNRHLVPFEHNAITYFVECPIYVARQIQRYRTAIISERSLRYCEPLEEEVKDPNTEFYREAYKALIRGGLKKEKARAILPLWTVTQFYFTINLRNLLHLFDQRLDAHAQEETRELAGKMFEIAKKAFPETLYAYQELKKEEAENNE